MTRQCDLVVVANRLPVREGGASGDQRWETSPGGLVSAVMPILRQQGERGMGGAWIGWAGLIDQELEPFEHDGVLNVPLALSREDLSGYYDGMANSTLWPLYHDVVRPPRYKRSWWRQYEQVNRIFARAAAEHSAYEAFVWVHDYHLHLVPRMLRELRPDLRIGFFLHIPFPGRGLFAQLPWRGQIIRGTLGADVVGFQTRYGARNFVELARRYADAHVESGGVRLGDRHIEVDEFPISIDAKKFDEMARRDSIQRRAREIREQLGNRTIMLGVDRMDYTKGIDTRLKAYAELLRDRSVSPSEVVLVQSAVPTRERVDDYGELRSSVEELVGQINGEFGALGQVAVEYLRQNLDFEHLVSLYLAADIMLVTPLRDGMNLVAKEYIATRTDSTGVLVLSEFTGAANELKKAVLVNPHDLDGMVWAMEHAIQMNPAHAKRRMRSLRRQVLTHDVFDWAGSFMARLRQEQPIA